MNNNIQCSIESSTTKIELNSAVDGVFLVPELEGLVGLPEIRTTSGVNAGYDGGWTSAQNYDARLISIRGVIANPDISKVEDKRRAIASLLGQGRKEQLTLRFTTEAGNAYAISVRTISCEMALQRVLTTQEFLIQLRADDPLIYDDGTTGGIAAILQPQRALGGFEINFGLPLAIGGGAEDTVVDNGNETVYPVIKLYGALHSPTVVNRTTNQQMQILADLQYSIDWHTYRSATGDYILVSDGLNGAPMTLSQLTGNAEQTTYSGKNLLNINAAPTTAHATRSISGQSITVTTDNQAATARVTLPIAYEANREMTISFDATCLTYEPTAVNTVIVYMRTTGQSDPTTAMSINKTVGATVHYTATFTPDNGTKDFWFYIKSSPVAGVASFRFDNVQVEYGASETSYEKFVGGIPAPNPSYPQPISTVTGEQTVAVTGKNLLSITADSALNQGTYVSGANTSTYTIKATGNDLFVNTVSTAGTPYTSTRGNLISCNYGETIYFNVGNNNFQKNYFTEWDENLMSLGYTLVSSSSGTYTPTKQGCKYVNFRFGNGYSVPDTTYTLSPIVCKTSNTSYEPYQGQSQEINLGKNLWGGFAYIWTSNWNFDTIFNKDGSFSISGNASENSWSMLTATALANACIKLEAGTYTFSFSGTASRTQLVSVRPDGTGEVAIADISATSGAQTFTLTETRCLYPRVRVLAGNTSLTEKCMIQAGSQVTSYAPYFTPIELAKIGNYQDRIYKNDGKWYIEKQVGKIALDGAGRWIEISSGVFYTDDISDYSRSGNKPLSNNFTSTTNVPGAGSVVDGTIAFGASNLGTQNRLYVKNTTIGWTSETVFKQWLTDHPTTVYYALATPTTTEITDETLRAQLNFLASLYKGENNISLIGTGAQGEMAISYATANTVNQDIITIDSQARTITLNGQDVYHLKTSESEFLVLAPGENKLYLTSEVSDDSGYAEVKFKQGYLSI